MVIKNNVGTYITSQDSATISYLIWGIVGILLAIALEFAIVYNFFQSPLNEAIGIAVMLHLFVPWILMVLWQYIPAYQRRTKFAMYFAYIEDANIKSIKQNYHVCRVDETGVLFVDNTNKQAYRDWALMHLVDNLAIVKNTIFTDNDEDVANA